MSLSLLPGSVPESLVRGSLPTRWRKQVSESLREEKEGENWFTHPAGRDMREKKIKLIKKLNIHRTLFIKIHLAKWVK